MISVRLIYTDKEKFLFATERVGDASDLGLTWEKVGETCTYRKD